MSKEELAFGLRERAAGGAVILELYGDLDYLADRELAPFVLALADQDCVEVVVDLRAVTFMDAGGVRLLMRVHDILAGRGGRVILVRGLTRVTRVLRVARVESLFAVQDFLSQAWVDGCPDCRGEGDVSA